MREAIRNREIRVAEEYLELLRKGEDLDAHDSQPIHDELHRFTGFLAWWDGQRRSDALLPHRQRLRGGLRIPGVLDQPPQPKLPAEIDALLAAWEEVRRRGWNPGALQRFFEAVGLVGHDGSPHVKGDTGNYGPGTQARGTLTTRPFTSRDDCPLPDFGSRRKGAYRLVLLSPTARTGVSRVVDAIKDAVRQEQSPTIVLLPRVSLTLGERLQLRAWSWRNPATFLLVDDALVAWLSLDAGPSRARFFRCTTPFTRSVPYIDSGSPAPEMFYGRKREIEAIKQPEGGSSLVYGGRQLGKTALLRQVERDFRDPERQHFAWWIDLKTANIATARPTSDVWQEMQERLYEAGVLPSRRSAPKRVIDHVRTWLEHDEERRLLFLLDEADAFLDAEARGEGSHTPFLNLEQMKQLMQRTNGRFKVVFAGLHNVQRYTRQPNNPLVHLGKPLCIGPLLDEGEWREATELLELPFAALGFRLEHPAPLRIFADTNYYPSLIQIVARRLLDHLSQRVAMTRELPQRVDAATVQEVLRKPEVREEIRKRFQWTLDLDYRFQVLALAIAYGQIEAGDAWEGMSVEQALDAAMEYWEAGFRSTRSKEDIQALLDEMVGLGILRRGDGRPVRYHLRNANLLSLLGHDDLEIMDKLSQALDHPAPRPFSAAVFHRTIGESDAAPRYSALTIDQERTVLGAEEAHGLAFVFGSALAGLTGVVDHILHSLDNRGRTERILPDADIDQALETAWARVRDGTLVAVIPAGWDHRAVATAKDWLRRRQKGQRRAQVVFVGGPGEARDFHTRPEGAGVVWLHPWDPTDLERVLSEAPRARKGGVERVIALTGGWHSLVELWLQSDRQKAEQAVNAAIQSMDPEATLGIRSGEAAWFRELHSFGDGLRRDDITVFADLVEAPAEAVTATFEWASHLGYLQPDAKGGFRLDPIVARILGSGDAPAH